MGTCARRERGQSTPTVPAIRERHASTSAISLRSAFSAAFASPAHNLTAELQSIASLSATYKANVHQLNTNPVEISL
jgi:hypothetical protein